MLKSYPITDIIMVPNTLVVFFKLAETSTLVIWAFRVLGQRIRVRVPVSPRNAVPGDPVSVDRHVRTAVRLFVHVNPVFDG